MIIKCCRRRQKGLIYQIVPNSSEVKEAYALYLKACNHCGLPSLEIVSFDLWGKRRKNFKVYRGNIDKFLSTMNVLWMPKAIAICQPKGKFNLAYQEYGRVNKCYSSFSNLIIGKVETDPLVNLPRFEEPGKSNL